MITGNAPWYPEFRQNAEVNNKIVEGDRPKRPNDVTFKYVKALWPIAEMCWHQTAKKRPNIIQVLERLKEIQNWTTGDETQIPTPDADGPYDDDTDEEEQAGSSSLRSFVFVDVDSLVQMRSIRTNLDCSVFN
jgi:hypothetical protein